MFSMENLPDDIRLAIASKKIASRITPFSDAQCTGAECAQKNAKENMLAQIEREKALSDYVRLPEKRKKEAEARAYILSALNVFQAASGLKISTAIDRFVKEIRAKRIEMPAWVVEAATKRRIKGISPASIWRWRNSYDAGGLAGLAPKYESKKKSSVPQDMQNFILGAIKDHPHISLSSIHAGIMARFNGRKIPSESAVRRWVTDWKCQNMVVHNYINNPDDWKNRYQFAFGNMCEDILRLNHVWEMDSTPGDLLLVDGRHTVIGAIDVYSRRMKLLVSPVSKGEAIGALIRRCLIEWGVAEWVRTDNGKDYVSKYIQFVLEHLQIKQELCEPFTPEQKPFIERALGTFSHDIVELMPGYIGHSVAERKAIESRKSFAEKMMKKGETVVVSMTAEQFQKICDRWTNAIYHQNPHDGLHGKTPMQMVREWTEPIRRITDERALDLLLTPNSGDIVRTVQKKGVEWDCTYFVSELLAGHEGEKMKILPDRTDLGTIHVFDENMRFVCTAIDPGRKGIDRAAIAVRAKVLQKQLYREKTKELGNIAKEAKTKALYEEITAHREKQLEKITEFPMKEREYTTPALDEAGRAAALYAAGASPRRPKVEISREDEKAAAEIITLNDKRRARMPMNDYECFEMLEKDRDEGKEISEEEDRWMKDYEHFLMTGKKIGIYAEGFQPFAVRQIEKKRG